MTDYDEGNLAAGTLVTDQFEEISVSTPSEFGVIVFNTNHPSGEDLAILLFSFRARRSTAY